MSGLVLPDLVETAVGVATLIGIAAGGWRWGLPRLKTRREVRGAMRDVLLGTPAVPANPITGDPGRQARLPLAQIVADMHHELHPNSGKSMRDGVDRIEVEQGEQAKRLAALEEIVGGVVAKHAETIAQGVATIDSALHAVPPTDEA